MRRVDRVPAYPSLLDCRTVFSKPDMSFATAITLVFGTFASAGTQATNWTRFARSGKAAVLATLTAFFLGNGLMVLMGALGALVYRDADIVNVLVMQGLLLFGLLMLFLNIWTTQDNAIYNFSTAGCNLLRTRRRRLITLFGAAIGTLLALVRIDLYLVPFLVMLGTLIPPLGGILIADFFYKHRRHYPKIADTTFAAFNPAGILAYLMACLVAFISPGVPPINGILTAIIAYPVLDKTCRLIRSNLGRYSRQPTHI